ncbi:hypothetical protein LSAT2_018092 [Lamellibrachia satsuma]|nr:hypothetical protein LSAT2_018092 [Lamellibrachia satsuma]
MTTGDNEMVNTKVTGYLPQKEVVECLLTSPDGRVKLAGLSAWNTLRLEAGMCLYGNYFDERITLVEASLAWTMFSGVSIILQQLKDRPAVRRVGCISSGPPQEVLTYFEYFRPYATEQDANCNRKFQAAKILDLLPVKDWAPYEHCQASRSQPQPSQAFRSQPQARRFVHSHRTGDSFTATGQAFRSQPQARRFVHSHTLGISFTAIGQAFRSQPQPQAKRFVHSHRPGVSFTATGQAFRSQPQTGQAFRSQPQTGQAFRSQPQARRFVHSHRQARRFVHSHRPGVSFTATGQAFRACDTGMNRTAE